LPPPSLPTLEFGRNGNGIGNSKRMVKNAPAASSSFQVQPVLEKMRLEMINEMQIEILNGEEFLVN